MREQNSPKPPIVRSLEALIRDPSKLVSVEIARISFINGGAFSGYAVNADPRSTLYNSDGRRFEVDDDAPYRSTSQDELRTLLKTGNFELVPNERGFHVFPISHIED